MDGLAPQLRGFIAEHFDSVESVEIVLLLRRSPQTFWAPAAVADQIGIREAVAGAKMNALARSGILTAGTETHSFRFAPRDETLDKLAGELAVAYADRRVSVINTIYSANLERIRAFSNAFKVS